MAIMAVSPSYRDFVLEQLGRVTPVTGKSIFGGVGICARGLFFALIARTGYISRWMTRRGPTLSGEAWNLFGHSGLMCWEICRMKKALEVAAAVK